MSANHPVARGLLAAAILIALAVAFRASRELQALWPMVAWGVGSATALLLHWEAVDGQDR